MTWLILVGYPVAAFGALSAAMWHLRWEEWRETNRLVAWHAARAAERERRLDVLFAAGVASAVPEVPPVVEPVEPDPAGPCPVGVSDPFSDATAALRLDAAFGRIDAAMDGRQLVGVSR